MYEASVDAYEWAVELEGDGGTVPMKDNLAKAKLKVADKKTQNGRSYSMNSR
jgi:hypothetical protein